MREPDITGKGVRAWKLQRPDPLPVKAWEGSVAEWLLNCTWAHPAWQWWKIAVVHLRPIEGVKPATLHYPAAEYEFSIYSIDPERCPTPDPDNPGKGYPMLEPIDVVHQFHGVSDRDASRILESAMRAIAAGRISPDQDYRQRWAHLLDSTVAHFRVGAHVEN